MSIKERILNRLHNYTNNKNVLIRLNNDLDLLEKETKQKMIEHFKEVVDIDDLIDDLIQAFPSGTEIGWQIDRMYNIALKRGDKINLPLFCSVGITATEWTRENARTWLKKELKLKLNRKLEELKKEVEK